MISVCHRTIFVHIPKCAGQSVETAFLTDNGLTWETRAPLLLKKNDDPKRGPPRLAHLTAAEYLRLGHVTAADFGVFFKFAVVRDPWSRAVSMYRHLAPNLLFRDFAQNWLPDIISSREASGDFWFVRPQSDFVTEAGQIIVDEIVRFESLAEEFPKLMKHTGLRTPLPHVNAAGQRRRPDVGKSLSTFRRLRDSLRSAFTQDRFELKPSWRDYYDTASAQSIARLYAEDVERFGYSGPYDRVSA